MRKFDDGDTIAIEPWRVKAFKLIRDLAVDRSAYDKIIQAGGFVSVNTGQASDASAMPIKQENAELAMDAAACIGCGACAAACPNASAMLFVSAKVSQLALLPQGKPEAAIRAIKMVRTMDLCGFGNCTNERECENACPKEIKITNIARLNREYIKASIGSSVM
jgi:succinate dehydrogenase / fumarate reductase iron-sulfur subunit